MANEMKLCWIQGRAWRATARGHELVADSPLESGGNNLGMKPGELLAAAVGSCMAMDLSYYAERHPNIDLSKVTINLSWQDADEKPSRIGMITGTVSLPAGLSKAERTSIVHVMGSCKIRRTLEHVTEIDIDFVFEE